MKKNLYYFLIPFLSVNLATTFPFIGKKMGLISDTIEYLNDFFGFILLPLSIIIYIIIMVENDRKESKRKRRSYKFTYLIVLPIVIFFLIKGVFIII